MVRVGEWVLGAAGAFAVFLGLFIMLAVVLAVTLRRPGRGGGTSWSRRSTS